jgi:hypothetical protein
LHSVPTKHKSISAAREEMCLCEVFIHIHHKGCKICRQVCVCVCAAQYLCETQFFCQVHTLFSLLYSLMWNHHTAQQTATVQHLMQPLYVLFFHTRLTCFKPSGSSSGTSVGLY